MCLCFHRLPRRPSTTSALLPLSLENRSLRHCIKKTLTYHTCKRKASVLNRHAADLRGGFQSCDLNLIFNLLLLQERQEKGPHLWLHFLLLSGNDLLCLRRVFPIWSLVDCGGKGKCGRSLSVSVQSLFSY